MRTGQPNLISPIKSEAQFSMLTRCATDPQYAAQRGIAPNVAQQMLSDHRQAGSPALIPGHVGDNQEKGPTPRVKRPGKHKHKLLGEQ